LKPRGLLTPLAVGIVLLVAAFALADALRDWRSPGPQVAPAEPTTTEEQSTETSPAPGPGPRPEAPEGWLAGALEGTLTFVDPAAGCRIRAIGLSGGRERPLTRFVTDCRGFWTPPIGARLAFGDPGQPDVFRIADLEHPRNDYGAYALGPVPEVFWSFDGQRAAWCTDFRHGQEREILGDVRDLPFCPVGYTPEGSLAYAKDNRLMVGDRTVLTATGSVNYARFGVDGRSVGVIVDLDRIERYVDGAQVALAGLPADPSAVPVFSPDTCRAAVPLTGHVLVVALGCEGDQSTTEFPGHAAAWSPDGAWLAVAELDDIVFRNFQGAELRWPAHATQLAWRP
jgi:hypothetical protein